MGGYELSLEVNLGSIPTDDISRTAVVEHIASLRCVVYGTTLRNWFAALVSGTCADGPLVVRAVKRRSGVYNKGCIRGVQGCGHSGVGRWGSRLGWCEVTHASLFALHTATLVRPTARVTLILAAQKLPHNLCALYVGGFFFLPPHHSNQPHS